MIFFAIIFSYLNTKLFHLHVTAYNMGLRGEGGFPYIVFATFIETTTNK